MDVNIQGIYKLVLCGNKVLQQLTQVTFRCTPEKFTSREESSVNMKIFIGFKDLHAKVQGLTMPDFYLSATSMTRLGTCPVIHMQSTNMVKMTTIKRMQTYYKSYDPKCVPFCERRM